MFIRVMRVEGAEGLVHEDDPGPEDQRAGDRHALPHAAGELVRILVLIRVDPQADALDPVAAQLVALAARHSLALEAEGDVVEHRAVVEARVVLKDHAAIGTRAGDRLPRTRTSPAVGGCCGSSPAISRRIVLLPQPLGPRTQMNSPLPIRSSTTNVTSRIAVNSLGWPAL